MKPAGKDGKLYAYTEGAAITSGPLERSGFYKIKSVAASESGLPKKKDGSDGRDVAEGDVVHLWKGQQLSDGDEVIPLTLTLIGFVTDVENSKQGESYDVSSQDNLESGVKEFKEGAFVESSGSISGFVDVDSPEQQMLLNNFVSVTEDDGEHMTVHPAKLNKQNYMLSRRETETPGETAMWEHFPVTVDSLSMPKPLNGAQSFNFNYKVDGGRHPGVIKYKVREVE